MNSNKDFPILNCFPRFLCLCDNYDATIKIDSEYITDTEINITLQAYFYRMMMYWFGKTDYSQDVIFCTNTITTP